MSRGRRPYTSLAQHTGLPARILRTLVDAEEVHGLTLRQVRIRCGLQPSLRPILCAVCAKLHQGGWLTRVAHGVYQLGPKALADLASE